MILCEGADAGWLYELLWIDDMALYEDGMWLAGEDTV